MSGPEIMFWSLGVPLAIVCIGAVAFEAVVRVRAAMRRAERRRAARAAWGWPS